MARHVGSESNLADVLKPRRSAPIPRAELRGKHFEHRQRFGIQSIASAFCHIGFSKAIAAYYAPQNIRVNVLAPALVETPMAQRAGGDEEIQRFIKTKQPLDGGRIGQPADLDAAAVYFLSDAARFTTGQVLAVDGGWSITDGLCE
jgi:NAD(P)-dependent dehydrogenase (short-subunit alcohol dehydrogenase family)